MKIVVGFVASPEGRAALDAAVVEARLRDADLVIVHSLRGGERDEGRQVVAYREEFQRLSDQLDTKGVRHSIREVARGNTPSEDLLRVAREEKAELVVIGIRRRSPVGKLVVGSNAQNVLLQADCAVLAVKSAPENE